MTIGERARLAGEVCQASILEYTKNVRAPMGRGCPQVASPEMILGCVYQGRVFGIGEKSRIMGKYRKEGMVHEMHEI